MIILFYFNLLLFLFLLVASRGNGDAVPASWIPISTNIKMNLSTDSREVRNGIPSNLVWDDHT